MYGNCFEVCTGLKYRVSVSSCVEFFVSYIIYLIACQFHPQSLTEQVSYFSMPENVLRYIVPELSLLYVYQI
jgi:hypothetical protein